MPEKRECSEAVELLYHYIDGQLTEDRRILIQRHLDECPPCLDAYDFEAELRVVIAHKCREHVPDRLRLRVARAIRALDEPLGGYGTDRRSGSDRPSGDPGSPFGNPGSPFGNPDSGPFGRPGGPFGQR